MVPCIFNDFPFYPDKTTNQFSIQNNCDLIRLVVSTVDPMTLEDLLCLCLVGSAKVISREDPMSIVGKYGYFKECTKLQKYQLLIRWKH